MYEVISMAFGEACAPWRLTKFMRELVRKWREAGINLGVYLDDFLIYHMDRNVLMEHVEIMRKTE